jgi:hypothetical protein
MQTSRLIYIAQLYKRQGRVVSKENETRKYMTNNINRGTAARDRFLPTSPFANAAFWRDRPLQRVVVLARTFTLRSSSVSCTGGAGTADMHIAEHVPEALPSVQRDEHTVRVHCES